MASTSHTSPDRFLVTYRIQDGENEYQEAFLFDKDDLEAVLRYVATHEMDALAFPTTQEMRSFLDDIRNGEPFYVDQECRAFFAFTITEVTQRDRAVLRRYLGL